MELTAQEAAVIDAWKSTKKEKIVITPTKEK